jgi:hypothetical protein
VGHACRAADATELAQQRRLRTHVLLAALTHAVLWTRLETNEKEKEKEKEKAEAAGPLPHSPGTAVKIKLRIVQ